MPTLLSRPRDLLRVSTPARLRNPLANSRILSGVAWNAAGSVVSQGGSFASSIIAARTLGKEVFGQFAMIQSTVVALSVIAGLGLGITATKFVSEYRTSDPDKAGRILGLSSLVAWIAAVVFSLAFLIAAPLVAGNLSQGLRLSTPYVFFMTANAYQVGAMGGFEAFRSVSRIQSIYGVVQVLLSWTLSAQWGLAGAVLAQGAAAMLLWILYHLALGRECPAQNVSIRYRDAWQQRHVLFRFSIPAAGSGMVAVAAAATANAILVRAAGFGELAVFSAVNTMRSMVLFLPALIARVTAPRLNHMKAAGDHTGYRRTFRTAVFANASISFAAALALTAAGPRILRLFGKDFAGSRPLVLLLLGSVVLEVIANNLFQALFTAGRLWRNLLIVCVWTAILTLGAVLLAPRYGATGLALSYLAAWSVSAFLYGRHA